MAAEQQLRAAIDPPHWTIPCLLLPPSPQGHSTAPDQGRVWGQTATLCSYLAAQAQLLQPLAAAACLRASLTLLQQPLACSTLQIMAAAWLPAVPLLLLLLLQIPPLRLQGCSSATLCPAIRHHHPPRASWWESAPLRLPVLLLLLLREAVASQPCTKLQV